MHRRDFLATALTATAALASRPSAASGDAALPATIAGMKLEQLRDDYRRRLFDEYLPFWEKGGLDRRHGGCICELNDDGSVARDEVYIWYQGRGLWVYSFLYNRFGQGARWLASASAIRDFLVRHMYAGEGKWHEKVRCDGGQIEAVGATVYGWLFAAEGLVEHYRAARRRQDLDLAKESIWAAVKAYDSPDYYDAHTTKYTAVALPKQGLRSQGHSMVLVRVLSQLLGDHEDARLRRLLDEHVSRLVDKFWNPAFGIVNEYLRHDYSRIPEADAHMLAGHALEALWIVMHESLRRKDRKLFDTAKNRIRRLIEMCYDYVFEGFGDGNFFVWHSPNRQRGPEYDVKTMWAQCEAMLACMSVLEYTGEAWAQEWYQRIRAFTLRTMPVSGHGVWRQAVDRQGKDLQRVGVSAYRKDNYHQVRYQMMNLLCLERMLRNGGRTSPFPV